MKRLLKIFSLCLAILIIAGCLAACSTPPPSDIASPDANPGNSNSGDNTNGSNGGNESSNGNSSVSTPVSIQPMYLFDGKDSFQLSADGTIKHSNVRFPSVGEAKDIGMNSLCIYALTTTGLLYIGGSNEKGMLCDPDLTKVDTKPKRITFGVNVSNHVLLFAMSETLCVALTQDSLYAWGELHDKGEVLMSWWEAPWEGISSTPVKIDLPNGITPQDVTHLAAGPEGFGLSAKGNSYYLGNYAAIIPDAGNVTFLGTAFWGRLEQVCAGMKSAHGETLDLFLREDGKVFVRGMPISDDLYYQWGDYADFENLIETPV